MQVTMQLSAGAASAVRGNGDTSANSTDLLLALAELEIKLEPISSESGDQILDSWFIAEVVDSDAAELLISRLAETQAVEAIYIKPPDEEP
jgi:hypothetical protein